MLKYSVKNKWTHELIIFSNKACSFGWKTSKELYYETLICFYSTKSGLDSYKQTIFFLFFFFKPTTPSCLLIMIVIQKYYFKLSTEEVSQDKVQFEKKQA